MDSVRNCETALSSSSNTSLLLDSLSNQQAAINRMSRSPPRTRRVKPTPSNSLILVLPSLLFSPSLLPLFELHFASYGNMLSWTPLERLGRVLLIYDEVESATNAKQEMDGFVWEDEDVSIGNSSRSNHDDRR